MLLLRQRLPAVLSGEQMENLVDDLERLVQFEHAAELDDGTPNRLEAAGQPTRTETALRFAAGLISTEPRWAGKHPEECYQWLLAEGGRG
jgi:hypothetical protein